jgi:hypothetical protein
METDNDPWNVTGTQTAASTNSSTDSAQNVNQSVPDKQVAVQSIPAKKQQDPMGTASLVFGIIAILLGGSPWGILGLVFGCISENHQKNEHATAGIICSVISLVFGVIVFVVLLFVLITFFPHITREFGTYL